MSYRKLEIDDEDGRLFLSNEGYAIICPFMSKAVDTTSGDIKWAACTSRCAQYYEERENDSKIARCVFTGAKIGIIDENKKDGVS